MLHALVLPFLLLWNWRNQAVKHFEVGRRNMMCDLSASLIGLLAEEFGDIYDHSTLARIVLASLVNPGDPLVGESIRRQGIIRTLEFILRARDRAVRNGMTRAQVPRAELIALLTLSLENEFVILTPLSPDWPKHFKAMGIAAPIALWASGDRSLLQCRTITITGSRTPTTYGVEKSIEFSAGLASRGWCISSGASYGIDVAAHTAALSVSGMTVAILASSLDVPFPSGNAAIIEQIFADGLVLSERAPGTPPARWRFLRRNALLGAFAEKTIIVEASLKSGSIASAEQAIAMNHSVGVVPGHSQKSANAGGHMLLRDYDVLPVQTVDDTEQI
jgi:DNA processing protein